MSGWSSTSLAGCCTRAVSSRATSHWGKSLVSSVSRGRQGAEDTGITQCPLWALDDYNGRNCRSIERKLKKYHWHIWPELPDKSAVAGYRIQLHNTRIFTKLRYMDRIMRDVTETEIDPKTWTGRVASACVRHGNLSSAPERSLEAHLAGFYRWVLRRATQVRTLCPYQGNHHP
jgi:L-rhamnose mutarotase